jgi:hypothetical protein
MILHIFQRFFSEYVAHLINKSKDEEQLKVVKFFQDIFESGLIMFFYKNDLEVIISVVIRDLENSHNEDYK